MDTHPSRVDCADPDSTVYVAGDSGLLGGALVRRLERAGYRNILTRSSRALDLTDQSAVDDFFSRNAIDQVILAAGRVGGIAANDSMPARFIYENLTIQTNVIHASWQSGAHRLLFIGSACIYPRQARQPIREEELLTGALEPSNEPYAIAKIAGIKTCESYNRERGTHFRSLMMTNLYGPNDNFHPSESHVVPALIRKFHEARRDGRGDVEVWGTGEPTRDFLYVDDAADACVHLMQLPDEAYAAVTQPMRSHINVGSGSEVSIAELARLIREISGYRGKIHFDHSRLDGTPRRRLDVSRLGSLGWRPSTSLVDGLRRTYESYAARISTGRASGAVAPPSA